MEGEGVVVDVNVERVYIDGVGFVINVNALMIVCIGYPQILNGIDEL